jgi:hypothetical protein
MNDKRIAPDAIPPINDLDRLLPKKMIYKNPARGNRGISVTSFSMVQVRI